MTNDSILKLAGGFHGLKTSRIRFCAFSYSRGVPWVRSFQVIMYFTMFSSLDFVTIGPVAYGDDSAICHGEARGKNTRASRIGKAETICDSLSPGARSFPSFVKGGILRQLG